jgi:hypothetical protein
MSSNIIIIRANAPTAEDLFGPQAVELVANEVSVLGNTNTWTRSSVNFGDASEFRYLILQLQGYTASSDEVSGVTASIGGVAATRVAYESDADGSDSAFAATFIAAVPTGTSGNIEVTVSGFGGTWDYFGYALWRVTGLDGPTPHQTASGSYVSELPTDGILVNGASSIGGTLVDFTGTDTINVGKSGRVSTIMYRIVPGTVTHDAGSSDDTKCGASWVFGTV